MHAALPETLQTEKNNIRYLVERIFPKAGDFNLGIVLICAYIIAEFGSVVHLYIFLNHQLKIPFIISVSTILYALYLVITKKVDLKSGFAKIFIVVCLFIIIYAVMGTKLPEVRYGLLKLFAYYLSAYIVCIASIKHLAQYILVIDVWLASILFSSFHGIRQGGLVWGNKWFRDENEMALLVAMALPYAFVFLINHKSKINNSAI